MTSTPILRFLALALALSAAHPPALGQTPAASPVRTVLATGRLASVVDMQLFFRLYGVHLPAGERVSYSGSNAMLYDVSGAMAIDIGGDTRAVAEGAGIFIPAGSDTSVIASGPEPATLLVFLLSPAPNQRRPVFDRPASLQEMFRTPDPLPGLEPGPYEFSLTRLVLPPAMPANRPHQRSGAALYYVLAGAGAVTADGKTEPRAQGAAQFEPAGWVHQWENPVEAPLVIVLANISREGAAAVVPAPK